MAPQSQPATQKMSISQLDAFLTKRLMATAISQNIDLGVFNLTPGNSTRVKLQNIGLLTRIRLLFTLTYTPSATATISQMGSLNAITNISLNDFTGQPRISASAAAIFMVNCRKKRRKPYGVRPGLGAIGGTENFGASALTIPSTGVTSGSAQTATFILDVPVCSDIDAGDLRGIIPVQSNVGEMYLNISMAALLGAANDDTKMFNGAATFSSVSGTVDVLQEYLLPQNDPISAQVAGSQYAFPIPPLSSNLVNEIVTVQTSDSIAVGSEKLIAYPNTRMIRASYHRWFNNSLQGGTGTGNDVQQTRLVLNGATPLLNFPNPTWMYATQREYLCGTDIAKGAYMLDFEGLPGSGDQPIQTASLGNLQLGLTPQTMNGGNTFYEFTTECLYHVGTSLGSIAPGS